MKLYDSPFSPNALRARAVIFELGLPVELVTVDLRGGNKTPDYLKLNPNGKVPVLVDGEVVIWESRAINAYLAAKYPDQNLYPVDLVRRAMVDQWSYWQAIHLGPAMQRINFERVLKAAFGMGEPDEKAVAAELGNVDQFLGVLETGLGDGREWIAGTLSIADFAIATTFIYRNRARIELDKFPLVAAWIARMEARPSWQKATEPMRQMQ